MLIQTVTSSLIQIHQRSDPFFIVHSCALLMGGRAAERVFSILSVYKMTRAMRHKNKGSSLVLTMGLWLDVKSAKIRKVHKEFLDLTSQYLFLDMPGVLDP